MFILSFRILLDACSFLPRLNSLQSAVHGYQGHDMNDVDVHLEPYLLGALARYLDR